jgi:hypothetical protein
MTAWAISPGTPVSMLTTPSGAPASTKQRTNMATAPVPSSAGRQTTVQPAANAGAILRAWSTTGKFHAMNAATGPTDSRSVMNRCRAFRPGSVSP